MNFFRLSTALVLAALVLDAAHAQKQHGDERMPRWMTPEAGFIDPESGSQVDEVSTTPDKDIYRVQISIPRVDKPIEEVLVIGQKDDKPAFEIPVEYEIINDLDNDRTGIILYMGKDQKFALRINYYDGKHSVFPQNDTVGGLVP